MKKHSPSRGSDIESHFLFQQEESDIPTPQVIRQSRSTSITRFLKDRVSISAILFHATTFALAVAVGLLLSLHRLEGDAHQCDPIRPSPAHEAIELEARPVDGLVEGSIYAGYPSPESDAAWNELMEGTNFKITPEEMQQLGGTSLAMRDGSGYLAVLGVYHELHCIKRLRHWLYSDYYYPDQSGLEYNERITHAEHCLEFIRQSALCHGDITVTTFKWLHDALGKIVEPTTNEGALHQCVNWDRLSGWVKSRRVDLYNKTLLVPEEPVWE